MKWNNCDELRICFFALLKIWDLKCSFLSAFFKLPFAYMNTCLKGTSFDVERYCLRFYYLFEIIVFGVAWALRGFFPYKILCCLQFEFSHKRNGISNKCLISILILRFFFHAFLLHSWGVNKVVTRRASGLCRL